MLHGGHGWWQVLLHVGGDCRLQTTVGESRAVYPIRSCPVYYTSGYWAAVPVQLGALLMYRYWPDPVAAVYRYRSVLSIAAARILLRVMTVWAQSLASQRRRIVALATAGTPNDSRWCGGWITRRLGWSLLLHPHVTP